MNCPFLKHALSASDVQSIYKAGSAGKIPVCTAEPSGIVSWWQGEWDASDVFASNPGVIEGNVTFTPAEVGNAFTFADGSDVRIPSSATLNAESGFTVEAWINPDDVSTEQPILAWNSGYATGVALWITSFGALGANVRDTALNDHGIIGGQITAGVFQHVALSFDGTKACLFVNGANVGQRKDSQSGQTPLMSGDLYFGFNPMDDEEVTGTQFIGQLDEIAFYHAALSEDEIHRLYMVAGGGKCGIGPTITSQPANQNANVGNSVLLQVAASGTSLKYQWYLNGSQVGPNATNSVLTLVNLQPAQAGSYSVQIANALGSVSSSPAVLLVNAVGNGTPPAITTQPSSVEVCADSSLTLHVAASGSELRYQWCKNGINISGETSDTYCRTHASANDAGTYNVLIYSSQSGVPVGHIASSCAIATVNARPTAVVSGDASISPGLGAGIQVALSGTSPWTLNWSDGVVESGVTDDPHVRVVFPNASTTYTLTAVSDAHCSASANEIIGSATMTVGNASQNPPMRIGITYLPGGTYNNMTLAADQTYYIDGYDINGDVAQVYFTGTTTIEGGAVVKFPPNVQLYPTAKITLNGPVVCHTGPYKPAIFAACDDDDYGYWGLEHYCAPDSFYGQVTGSYGYGLSLAYNGNVTLKNLRFDYLGCGVSADSTGTYNLYDCQFMNCSNGVAQTVDGAHLNLFNALFCDTTNTFSMSSSVTSPNVIFQQVTVDSCQTFSSKTGGSWTGMNSLLVGVENPSSIPSGLQNSANVKILTSGAGVFVQGGDGGHYLAGSAYRGQGTTVGLDGALLAELPGKSTIPPIDFPCGYYTSGSITLFPQVTRYTPGSNPDLGYYYDALDYTVSAMTLMDGAQLTVLPGTAVGMRFDWFYGFDVWQGASITSHGMPNKPNTFVPVSLAQEGPFPYTCPPGMMILFIPNYSPYEDHNPNGDLPPTLDFRFSNLNLNSGYSFHLWTGLAPTFLYKWLLQCTTADSGMYLQFRD